VTDTGIGMTDLVKAQVFDPFFTTKDKGKGTGLGLSVVYGIIQNHQGYIDIASTLGTGTAFTVYLPISPGQPAETTPDEWEDVPADSRHETVLVVEDEPHLNDLVCETLRLHGYAVVTAFDGEEAIRSFAEGRENIDLILCDLGLPKISGPDLFQQFKDIDPGVNVIFASGFFDPEVRSRLEAGAAAGFIQKPYRMNQLLTQLRAVLDRR